jgi:hypothetical protein
MIEHSGNGKTFAYKKLADNRLVPKLEKYNRR